MKKMIFAMIFFTASVALKAQVYPASNFTLISVTNPESGVNASGDKYSGCWGWYQQNKNKEYAIACSKSGTYWVDVTNPAIPVISAFRTGSITGATWREVKTYQNYCYVISDDGGSGANSFQIFDMQYLPDSVSKVYDSQTLIRRAHALWIDGNKLYVTAVRQGGNTFSSMNVYSLANPTLPTLIRKLDQDYPFINYVHDAFVRNDTVYASCGYQGLYVFKLTSTNNFSMLGSLTSYQGSGYNHSSALTPDGRTLVFTDEVPAGLPIKVSDVANLSNIQVLATTNQYTATTPHNPFMVSNQYCFVSSYKDGLQLFDISNPSSPTLAGYFDTYPQGGGNTGNYGNNDYAGQWGAYPFFPSKNIFALDMSNGIFMLKTSLYMNIEAAFTVPYNNCAGRLIVPVNNTTGAMNYSWTSSAGILTGSASANPTLSLTSAGIYTLTMTATNQYTVTTLSQTLAVQNLSAVVISTNSACQNCSTGIAKVIPSSVFAPYTYTWFPSGGNAPVAANLTPGCYSVTVANTSGCKVVASTCINVLINGIENSIEGEANISVYPNPASVELNILYPGTNFSLRLLNILGQTVKEQKSSDDRAAINISDLPAGIYSLNLQTGKNELQKKIIIKH